MSSLFDFYSLLTDTIFVNVHTLKSFALARQLNQSDFARAAGVTRQTVSHWFKQKGDGRINLYAKHLEKLVSYLDVSIEQLSQPLPILGNQNDRRKWETKLLWDRLFPNLETFIAGVIRGKREALARLVQVCGLYQSEKVAGRQVWRKFSSYKKLIHPAYRRQAEILWKTEQNLKLR